MVKVKNQFAQRKIDKTTRYRLLFISSKKNTYMNAFSIVYIIKFRYTKTTNAYS